MIVQKIQELENQQPSSLTHNDEGKGSTTISKESTGLTEAGKQAMYLKLSVIYKITNLIDGKIYIGSAVDFCKRFSEHNSRLRRNSHKNIRLQRAYNKYGISNFEFDIVEIIDNVNDLLDKEQYYLDIYKCYKPKIGYNICDRSSRNRFGMKMSKSAKRKIGLASKNRKFSEESILLRKRIATENQGKPILVYDKHCNLIYEFPSISETARQLNISIACISKQATKYRNILPFDQLNMKTHLGNLVSNRPNYCFRYKDIV